MIVNFVCQHDWATRGPDIWSFITLDGPRRMFGMRFTLEFVD